MLRIAWLFLAFTIVVPHGIQSCPRAPSIYQSRVNKIPGDNGFQIKINDKADKYKPGQVYTMYLVGSRTFDKLQHFKRFTINIESGDDPGNLSPHKVGSFQLFSDSLTKFNEDCVNTLSETNDLDKTEVFFMWTAPPPGSGCVTLRAMIYQDSKHWFADDGNLSRTICEFTENDVKYDENDCCACDEAKYSMIFEGIWSNTTHPKDFPFTLWLTHFSDVIGASHERNFSFWGDGQYASEGFKSLAEWGSVRLMESELRAKSKYLRTIIKAAGLWYPNVNTNTTTTFKVDRRHHLISLASMFGPSPDWVVGVNGLNLCLKNCSWIEDLIVDLYPFDAGTDSGLTYMSPNAETIPREKMYRITTKYPEDPRAPFYNMNLDTMIPMAKFYFKREKLMPKSCDENFLNAQLDISENTEDTTRGTRKEYLTLIISSFLTYTRKVECAVTDYSDWSECSVTCGKGLRMRSREYKMPQKANMFQCNRQLISKEMCVASVPECEGSENQESSEEKFEFDDKLCATTDWTEWSECSETCGIGFKTRTRKFIDRMGRKKCPTVATEEREKCMNPEVCREVEIFDPMCPVTQWSDWSPCSASCGKGVKMRTRLLLVDANLQEKCSGRVELIQQRPCVEADDCRFDMQTAKEVCMEDSVQGPCTGHFNRYYFDSNKMMCVPFVYGGCRGNKNNFLTNAECDNVCGVVRNLLKGMPSTQDGALNSFANPAILLSSVTQNINSSDSQPEDCVVSEWSPYGLCSSTCGLAYAERFRMIKYEAKNGGKACPKRLTSRRRCLNLPPC